MASRTGISRRKLADLLVMAGLSRRDDLESPIVAQLRETHPAQALQAGLVTQVLRPASVGAQQEPVQGRAAAGLKIRFIPHGLSP
ncbi:hypothetical protein AA101099_2096 [Neoasaia chiangmaiensis NBRC 101099]|nr:hypothetical protein AA101099_2096 [Neoasaia chiangmaiensis NBRC 101099]